MCATGWKEDDAQKESGKSTWRSSQGVEIKTRDSSASPTRTESYLSEMPRWWMNGPKRFPWSKTLPALGLFWLRVVVSRPKWPAAQTPDRERFCLLEFVSSFRVQTSDFRDRRKVASWLFGCVTKIRDDWRGFMITIQHSDQKPDDVLFDSECVYNCKSATPPPLHLEYQWAESSILTIIMGSNFVSTSRPFWFQ